MILPSSSKFFKTLAELTNLSHPSVKFQVNPSLWSLLNSTRSRHGSITLVLSSSSITPQQTFSHAYFKATVMDRRSACHRRSYSTHHHSLEFQPNKNSLLRMNQEFLLSTNGEYQTNIETKYGSRQTNLSFSLMKSQD